MPEQAGSTANFGVSAESLPMWEGLPESPAIGSEVRFLVCPTCILAVKWQMLAPTVPA